jgi:hypothetical protein
MLHSTSPCSSLHTQRCPTRHSISLTKTLHEAVQFLGPNLGFLPSEVSACSLRAAGAMALLVSGINTDIIQILGRWQSDEMFRYLHLSAEPITRNLAARSSQPTTPWHQNNWYHVINPPEFPPNFFYRLVRPSLLEVQTYQI